MSAAIRKPESADPRATLEAEAAAAAAATKAKLRADTTLDAVLHPRTSAATSAPAATLMLAPISVVGVAGVVVIAILLVRHLDPRGARRDGADGGGSIPGESALARRVPTRLGPGRRGWGERGGRLVKTSNANLRALFGGVPAASQTSVGPSSRRPRRRTPRAPPRRRSTSLRKGPGPNARWFRNGERRKPGFGERDGCVVKRRMVKRRFVSGVEPRARRWIPPSASPRRASCAARVRAKDAIRFRSGRRRRGTTTRCRGFPCFVERAGQAPPAAEVRSARRARRRAATRRHPCWTSPARFRVAGAFSAAEMRRSGREATKSSLDAPRPMDANQCSSVEVLPRLRPPSPTRCRRPGRPASIRVAPASIAPGRAVRLRRLRPSPRRRGGASSKRRRRARTRARCGATAAAPRRARTTRRDGPARRTSGGAAVMGAGRAVAPAQEGRPAMVKSTTRFL